MARQDDAAKLLAIGLLNYADDEGFFYATVSLIRSALRPFDDDSTIVRRSLETLSKIGFVEVREHPTHGPVGVVISFNEHQRVDRPKASIIKELFDSTNDRRMIDDESSLEGKGSGNREQGKEQGSARPARKRSAIVLTEQEEADFAEFWQAYPKRTGRGTAEESWAKMRPPLAEVLAALTWQRESHDWTKERGQFIPMPSTYINQKRWLDEPATPKTGVLMEF